MTRFAPGTRLSRADAAVVIGAIGCALTVHAGAAGAGLQRAAPADAAARDYVAIGCVSAEAPRTGAGGGAAESRAFLITDVRSKTQRYRLEGDVALLELHAGHTIEVTGTISTAAGAPSVVGDGATLPTLKVRTLIYISRSCRR
jgi:hypothetical protein